MHGDSVSLSSLPKCRLHLGNIVLDVSMGTPCSFRQVCGVWCVVPYVCVCVLRVLYVSCVCVCMCRVCVCMCMCVYVHVFVSVCESVGVLVAVRVCKL